MTTAAAPTTEALLRIRGMTKAFPGTRALDDVDLDLAAGEVHALVGQNGSGKSTLIKVLAGYHAPDNGPRWSSAASRSASATRPPRAPPGCASSTRTLPWSTTWT